MSIRSVMLALAVGTVGLTSAVAEPMEKTTNTGGFQCTNGVGVGCVGSISIFPITVNIKDVDALSNNDLDVLEGSLNNLSILDGGILNHNTILNDAELTVLDDFLNKFDIDIDHNDVNVCTSILGVLLCK